jgi:uncharacterized membrane protein YgdD (TMEM256/DUF423 family)
MFVAVGAGAFGAHGLASYFEQHPRLERTYETAVRYHMIHALALFVTAWASTQWSSTLLSWAGYLFLAGIIVFSGSLYLLVLTRISWLGAITPLGGLAYLGGWLLLLITAWRG